MSFLAIILIDWVIGAWALMVVAGIVHAVALPVLIPFGFGVAITITGVWAMFGLIRGGVALLLAAMAD